MPFIGTQPEVGGYSVLDALTASATASYTLQLNSANFVPASANQLLVSLNGVIQKPGSSFTISGSTLTFSSALTSSDSIDFIISMGEPLLIGTPSDGTVTSAKLDTNIAVGGTLGVTGATTTTGGVTIPASTTVGLNFGSGTNLAQLAMQSAVLNRVALRTTHTSTGDNNPFIVYQPSSAGVQNDALVINTGGQINMSKQPAFHAYRNGGNYTKSSSGYHKVLADATRYNIGSHYDTSNHKFTAPIAGRYLFTIAINTYTNGADNQYGGSLYVNGAHYVFLGRHYARGDADMVVSGSAVIQLAASDYVEMYSYNSDSSFGYSSGYLWQTFTGCLLT